MVATFVVTASVCVYIFPPNPLWKSRSDVKEWILKEERLGSSVSQVKAFIEAKKWRLVSEWHGNPSNVSSEIPYPSVKNYPAVKGEYFIQADLGSYQAFPFRVGVDAHWGFDSAERLLDLRIRKMPEGL
jgi:hypothetical protein